MVNLSQWVNIFLAYQFLIFFIKKKKTRLKNSNFGEDSLFSSVFKKDEREEVKKKLLNKYEILFIP